MWTGRLVKSIVRMVVVRVLEEHLLYVKVVLALMLFTPFRFNKRSPWFHLHSALATLFGPGMLMRRAVAHAPVPGH